MTAEKEEEKTLIERIKSGEDIIREIVKARLEGTQIPPDLLTPAEKLMVRELDLRKDLRQFGYDIFQQRASRFGPSFQIPVGPDYVIGSGDELTVTLWGIVEGIFQLKVSREGEVTLPKVGVVPVAGVQFGEIEPYLSKQLSRYYKDFNIRVVMGRLRTIQVYVVGEVKTPGSYTLSSLATTLLALFTAGGPTKDGSLRRIEILRRGTVVRTLDLYDFLLKGDTTQDIRLETGDTVFVPLVGEVVAVAGEVYRPAIYELKGAANLQAIFEFAGGVLPTGSGDRIQIERFQSNERKVVLDIGLGKSEPAATILKNLDLVKVYPVHPAAWGVISMEGTIGYPGEYAFRPGMRISDLMTRKQLSPKTYLEQAELVRLDKQTFQNRIIDFSPMQVLQSNMEEDLLLEPQDRLVFYSAAQIPGSIQLEGEIGRPGSYAFEKGERLSSVLKRAGGFTDKAFLIGAVFTRRSVAATQQEQKEIFLRTQERALLQEAAAFAASGVAETGQAAAVQLNQRQQLLRLQSERVEEGRVVIQLGPFDEFEGGANDLFLEDGDKLIVPQVPAYVTVLGEVRNPSAFVYSEGKEPRYYVARAGGFTSESEEKEAYILRADGSAALLDSRAQLLPGDSVVIPTKFEVKYRPLDFWTAISAIVSGAAVTIAAIVTVF